MKTLYKHVAGKVIGCGHLDGINKMAATVQNDMRKQHQPDGAPINTEKLMSTMYSPILVGGGAATTYGGSKIYSKTNLKYRKGLLEDLGKFKDIQNTADPGDFVRDYTGMGHKLMNEKVKYKGKTYTAHDVIKKLRQGGPGKVLERAGFMGQYRPIESKAHYNAFISSQDDAIKKILSETWSSDSSHKGVIDFYKGVRYQAYKNLAEQGAKIEPDSVFREAAKIIAKDKQATPEEAKHILKGILNTEQGIQAANPRMYAIYNKHIGGAITSQNTKSLQTLDKIKERLFNNTGYHNYDTNRMISGIKSGNPDVVTSIANVDLSRNFKKSVKNGYGNIYNAVLAVKKMNKAGKKIMIGGGGMLLGGVGLAAYGLSRDNNNVEKTGTERRTAYMRNALSKHAYESRAADEIEKRRIEYLKNKGTYIGDGHTYRPNVPKYVPAPQYIATDTYRQFGKPPAPAANIAEYAPAQGKALSTLAKIRNYAKAHKGVSAAIGVGAVGMAGLGAYGLMRHNDNTKVASDGQIVPIHDMDGNLIYNAQVRRHIPKITAGNNNVVQNAYIKDILAETQLANKIPNTISQVGKKVEYVTDEDKLLRQALRATFDPAMTQHYPEIGDAANAASPIIKAEKGSTNVSRQIGKSKPIRRLSASKAAIARSALIAAGVAGVGYGTYSLLKHNDNND